MLALFNHYSKFGIKQKIQFTIIKRNKNWTLSLSKLKSAFLFMTPECKYSSKNFIFHCGSSTLSSTFTTILYFLLVSKEVPTFCKNIYGDPTLKIK